MQRGISVYHPPEIRSIIFRRGSCGYLHVICQSIRGPLAFVANGTPGGQFARTTAPGRVVSLDPTNVDEVILPLLIHCLPIAHRSNSVPYLIRLVQCLTEYKAPLNQSRRPLYNAIKYATSFPVIYLSAAQRIVVSDLAVERGDQVRSESWHGEHQLFRLWYVHHQ